MLFNPPICMQYSLQRLIKYRYGLVFSSGITDPVLVACDTITYQLKLHKNNGINTTYLK